MSNARMGGVPQFRRLRGSWQYQEYRTAMSMKRGDPHRMTKLVLRYDVTDGRKEGRKEGGFEFESSNESEGVSQQQVKWHVGS